MKARLILMRHAKSSWSSGAPTDHARPLNKRGRNDAPRMADALAERGWVPEIVLSSDSQRTRETWSLMDDRFDAEVVFLPELYHAGAAAIVAAVREHASDASCILVLGHNPGWEDALQRFSGSDEAMTTANCALLERDADWSEPFDDDFTLAELIRPKEL